MVRQQGQILGALDGVSAAWSTVSLHLWSAAAHRQTDEQRPYPIRRGAYLRQALRIDDEHMLRGHGLRNRWIHRDEHLLRPERI